MAATLRVSRTTFEPAIFASCNASGVVPVGGSRFAFIDNRDTSALFELTVSASGAQQGPVTPRPLAGIPKGTLTDPEGLALADIDGTRTLIAVSSLSTRVPGVAAPWAINDGLVRIRYTPHGDLQTDVMADFREWLLKQYPDLEPFAKLRPDDKGLNIEGLAWDSARSELVFGIRSPTAPPHATLLRVHLDTHAPWTVAALDAGPAAHVHSATLPTQGIRDITYDSDRNEFLILLGRSLGTDLGVPFQLCVWDGTSTAIDVLHVEFEPTMKPEGVTVFDVAGTRHVLIVDDAGGFATFKAHDVPGWI
jgi:hypothetical protein